MSRTVSRGGALTLGSASARAVARMREQGLVLPRRPEESVPRLPSDLTDLDDAQLMSLFADLTRWAEYMGVQVAAAEVDEKSADAELAKVRALASLKAPEKTVTATKARAYEDEEVTAVEDARNTAYAYRKMVGALYDATDRKAQVVSRELTRRVGREPRENRAGKWAA